jgi:hypothetical protein
VLLAGVAQIGLGAGQALHALKPPSIVFTATRCALVNDGCLLVIVGTLLVSPVAVSFRRRTVGRRPRDVNARRPLANR